MRNILKPGKVMECLPVDAEEGRSYTPLRNNGIQKRSPHFRE